MTEAHIKEHTEQHRISELLNRNILLHTDKLKFQMMFQGLSKDIVLNHKNCKWKLVCVIH